MSGAGDLEAQADRLLRRIGAWTPSRWKAAARVESVYGVVQQLADLAADAEHRPRRGVPRLADTVLPDQTAVVVGDLADADEGARAAAAQLLAGLWAQLS